MQNPFRDFKNPFRNTRNPFRDMKNPFPHLEGRKLYRSPKDAVVFGICAGIAEYLQVDPVFIRLIVLALGIFGSVWPVTIVYVVAAFLIPIDPAQDTVANRQEPKDVTAAEPPQEKMDSNQNM